MSGFGAFLSGAMQGYQIGENLQDQRQKRALRDYDLKEAKHKADQREADQRITKDAAGIVQNVGVGLDGDGMGPPSTAAGEVAAVPPTPPVEATMPEQAAGAAPVAADGVQPAVGLPAGQVGPGQMRPAAIEAAGVTAPPPAMPTATMPEVTIKPPKAEPAAKPKDNPNYHETRIRLARERGLPELAAKYEGEYADHVVRQSKIEDAAFDKEMRPLRQEMARIKTKADWEALPAETRARVAEAQAKEADMVEQRLYRGLTMTQSDFTSKQGLKLLSDVAGVEISALKTDGEYVVAVGTDGKPVEMDGKPMRIHKDAIGRLQAKHGPKPDNVVLPDGAKLANRNTGQVVATNEKDPRATPDQTLQRQNQATSILGTQYGTRDAMGNLTISPEKREEHDAVLLRAHELARGGMDAAPAIAQAQAEYRKKAPPAPGAAAPAAAKPVDTKKYGF